MKYSSAVFAAVVGATLVSALPAPTTSAETAAQTTATQHAAVGTNVNRVNDKPVVAPQLGAQKVFKSNRRHRHRKGKKTAPSVPTTPTTPTTPEATSPAPIVAAPVVTRNFDDELFTRDFDEILEARGKRRGRKGRKSGNSAPPTPDVTTPTSDATTPAPDSATTVTRNFEELETRGKRRGRKNRKSKTGDSTPPASGTSTPSIPNTPDASSPGPDSVASVTRDFSEELFVREFDEELFARAMDEILEARGKRRGRKGRKAQKGGDSVPPTPDTATLDASSPAPDSAAAVTRDFDEDLFTRDFDEILETRGKRRGRKGRKAQKGGDSVPPTPDTATLDASSPAPDSAASVTRDFEEDLFTRDFDEILEARGKRRGRKGRKAQKGGDSVPPTPDTATLDASSPAPDSAASVTRDFDDELFTRHMDEILEARGKQRGKKGRKQTTPTTPDTPVLEAITPDVSITPDAFITRRGLWANLKANYENRQAQSQSAYRRDLDEVEARGLASAFGAIVDTFKGKKAAPVDPNAAYRREFLEDLDARDFEVDELD